MDRPSKGYKRAIHKIWRPKKTDFWAQKKRPLLDSNHVLTMFDREKLWK